MQSPAHSPVLQPGRKMPGKKMKPAPSPGRPSLDREAGSAQEEWQ